MLSSITARGSDLGRIIFEDTLYGMGIGALVGGALTLTTDKPADHLNYLSYGLLAGGLVGIGVGAYEVNVLYADNGLSGTYVSNEPVETLGFQIPSLALGFDQAKTSFDLTMLSYNF